MNNERMLPLLRIVGMPLLAYFLVCFGAMWVCNQWPIVLDIGVGIALPVLAALVAIVAVQYYFSRKKFINQHDYWFSSEGKEDDIVYFEWHEGKEFRCYVGKPWEEKGSYVYKVPNEVEWELRSPDWAKKRRQIILRRLREFPHHRRYTFHENPITVMSRL